MRVRVSFDIDVPGHVSREDVIEWVKFELKTGSGIKTTNPMSDREIEPLTGTLKIGV